MTSDTSWFVLRFPSQQFQEIQHFLNQNGIINFAPVKFVVEEGVTKRIQVLPGHVFVQGPQDRIDEAKREFDGDKLKYLMPKDGGRPLSFDDRTMQSFIKVASQHHAGIEYLDARREINVKHGPMVRVTDGGPFDGVEGEYLRVRSNRCVVVRVGGLVTVATGFLKPDAVKQL